MTSEKQTPGQNPLLLAAGFTALLSGLLLWLRSQTRRGGFVQSQSGTQRERALITGASSGIGEVYARQLAAQGYNLVIVARRENRLRTLAGELETRYGVDVQVLAADLTDAQDLESLVGQIHDSAPLALVVNNAGFATHGKFARIPIDRQLDMVRLHLQATMQLTRAALPGMLARGHGAIINVSSIASFFPIPGSVTYSSTKSFFNIFSETLQMELSGTGVSVQALCPGFTHTGFHSTEEQSNSSGRFFPEFMWSQAGPVVETSLNALGNGQVIVIPGLINQVIVAFARSQLIRPIVKLVLRWLYLRPQAHSGPLARSN